MALFCHYAWTGAVLLFPTPVHDAVVVFKHPARDRYQVCDKRNEAIIAKPTASESGRNIERGTPDISTEGTNTARYSTRSVFGRSYFYTGIPDRLWPDLFSPGVMIDIFDGDRRFVYQYSNGKGPRRDIGVPSRGVKT